MSIKVPPSGNRPPGTHGVRRPRRHEHAPAKGSGAEEGHEHEDVSQELNRADLKKAMPIRDQGGGGQGGDQQGQQQGDASGSWGPEDQHPAVSDRAGRQQTLGAQSSKPAATTAPTTGRVAEGPLGADAEARLAELRRPRRKTYEAIRAAVNLENPGKPGEVVQKHTPSKPIAPGKDATSALNNSQPPGVFFIEDGEGGPAVEDLDLEAAVEELRAQLQGVPGILHVGSGVDETQTPIVVVSIGKGATQASLQAIPGRARQYATVVAVPYDILPLKRERFFGGGGTPVP